jgi:hypothetical protein
MTRYLLLIDGLTIKSYKFEYIRLKNFKKLSYEKLTEIVESCRKQF